MRRTTKRALLLMGKDVLKALGYLAWCLLVIGVMSGYLTQFTWFQVVLVVVMGLLAILGIAYLIREWFNDRVAKAQQLIDAGK